MKTLKKLFFGIFAIFFASVAFASGNLQVNLLSNDTESAIVKINNAKMVNYEIKLVDEYGDRLYSMKTKAPQNELKKRYDLTNLEDGVYWYTVEIDKEKVTKQLAIKNGVVEVVDIRKSVEPYFQQKDNYIDLSMLNYGKEDIKIYVYDQSSALIDKAELGNDFTINKRVDLSELRPGNYNIVVANDYDVYSESVKIN
jgi:hypothetical protein